MEKKFGRHSLNGLENDIKNEFEISTTGYGLESVEETDNENKDRQTEGDNPSCGGL